MLAGRLNQRVEIQAATNTCDSYGQPVSTWATVATVWATVEPINGREYETSLSERAEITHKIIMRYYSGLSAQHRLKHGTKIYQIVAVLNLMSGRKDVKVMTKELPATAI